MLPKPKLRSQNPPSWFLAIRDGQQDQLDLQYLHGPTTNSVDAYNTAAKAWIENQSKLRETSGNPENYTPTPFVRPLPQREVYDWDEAIEAPTVWLMEPDPNIHPPVLPPYVKPTTTPNAGFKTSPDPMQTAMLNMLAQILQLLRAKQ